MKSKSRKIVYLVFWLIFLVSAPLVLLYTSGYRYNFDKGRVQKTGIMIISTLPKKASILLNGKAVEGKATPTEIRNVLPGDYEITLAKDGYHDWRKKLPVYENSTTFAEKVMLWKKSQPQALSRLQTSAWSLSPDGKKTAFADEGGRIYILSLEDSSFRQLAAAEAKPKSLAWSPDSKKLLAKNESGFSVYGIDTDATQKPTGLRGYSTIRWPQSESGFLYGLDKDGVWKVSLASGRELLAKPGPTDDFLIVDSDLYLIEGRQLLRLDLKNPGLPARTVATTANDRYHFVNERYGFITLRNDFGKTALVSRDAAYRTLEFDAKRVEWLNKDILLYYSDFEIHLYDFNRNASQIITRLSSPISRSFWHPDGKHVIYASGERLDIVELDDRELRNVITLADSAMIGNMEIAPDGDDIYFSGSANGEAGIFRLELR